MAFLLCRLSGMRTIHEIWSEGTLYVHGCYWYEGSLDSEHWADSLNKGSWSAAHSMCWLDAVTRQCIKDDWKSGFTMTTRRPLVDPLVTTSRPPVYDHYFSHWKYPLHASLFAGVEDSALQLPTCGKQSKGCALPCAEMRGSTKKAEVNLSWAVIYGKEATERKSLEGDCREGGGEGGRKKGKLAAAAIWWWAVVTYVALLHSPLRGRFLAEQKKGVKGRRFTLTICPLNYLLGPNYTPLIQCVLYVPFSQGCL